MKLSLALALLPAASAFAPSRSGARATTVTNIAVGDSVPADTVLVKEFPFDTIDVPARLAGFNEGETLKTFSCIISLLGTIGLAVTLLLANLWPHFIF